MLACVAYGCVAYMNAYVRIQFSILLVHARVCSSVYACCVCVCVCVCDRVCVCLDFALISQHWHFGSYLAAMIISTLSNVYIDFVRQFQNLTNTQ